MYQQFAVQSSTPWQRVRTLSCIVMGLSTVVIVCSIISLALVSQVTDQDSILITDKINCEQSSNGLTGSVCKDNIDCYLCATKSPKYVKSGNIWPPIIGMLTGIGICLYMMAYVCNCECVKFPEQQLQFIPPQPQQFNSSQPQQIIQMQPVPVQPGQII
jgi:hypothetical protein